MPWFSNRGAFNGRASASRRIGAGGRFIFSGCRTSLLAPAVEPVRRTARGCAGSPASAGRRAVRVHAAPERYHPPIPSRLEIWIGFPMKQRREDRSSHLSCSPSGMRGFSVSTDPVSVGPRLNAIRADAPKLAEFVRILMDDSLPQNSHEFRYNCRAHCARSLLHRHGAGGGRSEWRSVLAFNHCLRDTGSEGLTQKERLILNRGQFLARHR